MLHLSSWMTTLPMMLIGMTGILLVIGFLASICMRLINDVTGMREFLLSEDFKSFVVNAIKSKF